MIYEAISLLIAAQIFGLATAAAESYDEVPVGKGTCVGTMTKTECVSFIQKPWDFDLPSSREKILTAFGKPNSDKVIDQKGDIIRYELAYDGLNITLFKGTDTIFGLVSISSPKHKIKGKMGIGTSRQQIESLLGPGTKTKPDSNRYCAGEAEYCIEFEFSDGRTKQINWVPYAG